MALDSEMSTTALSLSKIRKDYLKLSKAKLSKQCKALNLDAYGTKAVLVDILMKEHEKKISPKPSKPSKSTKPTKSKHTNTKQPKKKNINLNVTQHQNMSKHKLLSLRPLKNMKLKHINRSNSHTILPGKPRLRKRSKSMAIQDIKSLQITDRTRIHKNKSDKSQSQSRIRRSSMTNLHIKNRKDLLKMSRNEIIKQCKMQHVNINGLRNKNDMINRIVNMEQLFQEKKKRNMEKINNNSSGNAMNSKSKVRLKKRKKMGLVRSKSEESVQRIKAKKTLQSNHVTAIQQTLTPLKEIKDVKCEIKQNEKHIEADLQCLIALDCDFIKCVSRRRLIIALQYYEDNYNEQKNNEDMIALFMQKYKYLLSDWHHVLVAHLDCKLSDNYKNFNVLYDDIKKHHLLCDISECSHYIKNNRNMEDINIDEDDDIDLNNRFIMDLIANIHIYLVHSFDIGFRMRNYNEFGVNCKKRDDEKKDGIDEYKYLYYDDEMQSFEGYYDVKRKELLKIRGVQRMKRNKYFTSVDYDTVENKQIQMQNNTDKDEDKTDVDIKSDIDNAMNLNSMKQCNTKQIIHILKEYFFDDVNSDILNKYKKKIIAYFEENEWNGTELSTMTEISFVTELIIRCDNNKQLKPDLVKLFNLFDFSDFSDGNSTQTKAIESESETKCIKNCNHEEIIYILQHYLFDKIKNTLLHEHRNQIMQYFVNHNINGSNLFGMKKKKFCENMIKHCNNNRKLNHSFILLYKEFFKLNLSEIDFSIHDMNEDMDINNYVAPGPKKTNINASQSSLKFKQLINKTKINKKRKRRGTVEPQFTSGYRFLYWQYYQKDKWFVHKKYSNLKEEILDNIIHSLNGSKWDEAYNKALHLSKSEIIKSMTCNMDKWIDLYAIEKGSSLKISHLLSLVLYTDYIDLAIDFVASFKKLTYDESNEQLRDRNANYANWARCLRETVECFGCKIKETKADIFYYGICEQFIFQSFIGRFYAPTSTTTQLSVVKIFAPENNGIILELEKYKNGLELTYFNCSLISNFSSEDERLFIGGYRPLQFHSIRVINKYENYMWFITALTIFNAFLNGKKLNSKQMKCVKSRHYMIINKLCRHKASLNRNDNRLFKNYFRNKFPDYINHIFDGYCNKKKQVVVNLKWLNQCYPGFKSYFTQSVSNDELKSGNDSKRKRGTLNNNIYSITPESISTKPKHSNSKQHMHDIMDMPSNRPRRRHSFSGSVAQTDIIKGKYLFDIFKYINPVHVITEIEGVSYDIVATLPHLIFVYKLNKESHPISIDNRIQKDFDKSIRFRNNLNLIYIQNPLYKYYLSKPFYVKHIIQILDYFFNSKCLNAKKCEKRNMSINNVSITEILKWKYNIYRNKIKFSPEIYKYFNDKKEINININRVKLCAQASQSLLHEKCKRLCFFNIISSLFTKCETIICYDIKVISSYYLQELLIILQNENKNNKHYKLKHIILYQPLKIQTAQHEFQKFKQKFVRNNWKMTKKLHNNNQLYLCFDKIVLRR